MNVICTDGTRFYCDRYELTEKGVKLYSGDIDDEPGRYESDTDDHQVGFVPDARLLYILPDGVAPTSVPAVQPTQQPTDGVRSSTRQQPTR